MKDSGGNTIYSISWTYDNVGDRATQIKDGNQTSYTYPAFPRGCGRVGRDPVSRPRPRRRSAMRGNSMNLVASMTGHLYGQNAPLVVADPSEEQADRGRRDAVSPMLNQAARRVRTGVWIRRLG